MVFLTNLFVKGHRLLGLDEDEIKCVVVQGYVCSTRNFNEWLLIFPHEIERSEAWMGEIEFSLLD